MNKKSKLERILIISSLFILGSIVLCVTGCGGASCETIQCGSLDEEGISIKGISIPGCGGCLSSGSGCNCALWPQAVKISCGRIKQDLGEDSGEADFKTVRILGCNDKYYGKKDIFGCDTGEKSSYAGLYIGGCSNSGCFLGGTDSKEKNIGCIGGDLGCFSNVEGNGYILDLFEEYEGIN